MSPRSLVPPESGSCAFCAYLNDERPYVFLWRDQDVAVAVTQEQRGVAHVIVFPVKHVETILELDRELAGPLMVAIRDASVAIDASERRPGISVWQNNGIAAGQKIDHLHFHVAGTLPGGGTEFGIVPEISIDDARNIAKRLAVHVRTEGDAATRRFPA